jgi:hypothetical protein
MRNTNYQNTSQIDVFQNITETVQQFTPAGCYAIRRFIRETIEKRKCVANTLRKLNYICRLNAKSEEAHPRHWRIKAEIWTKVVQICRFSRRLRSDRLGITL